MIWQRDNDQQCLWPIVLHRSNCTMVDFCRWWSVDGSL